MKGLKYWTIAVLSLCAVSMNVHAQSQKDEGALHGNQSKANVICDVHSLQDAVDRAAEGATITVQGTCTGEVVIRKDRVRIVGESGATIQPPVDGVGFTVLGDGVEIRDMNIVGGAVGIDIFGTGSAEITGNQILDYTRAGIEVRSNSHGTIRDNYISSPGGAFAGVNLLASASALLDDNEIVSPGGFGVNIAATSSALLSCNTVSLTHPFFAGVIVSRTAQVGFAIGCPNTISNSHAFGRSIVCSQTSSIFAGANQNLTGMVQRHPNCEVVTLPGVVIP